MLARRERFVLAIFAIGCASVLEGIALWKGLDGFALAAALAFIASIVGAAMGVRVALPSGGGGDGG